jgi:glucokinase
MTGTFSIGVDLGGTSLRVASYVSGVTFLDSISVPTRLSDGRDLVVRDMCEAIRALQAKEYGRVLAGIGVGSPGPLELPDGIVRSPPNLPGWERFNLRKAVEGALGQPIVIENDANLAALAEQKLGAGMTHNVDSLCMITLGTGVGSGFILDGRIWHGAPAWAARLGM